MLLRDRNELSWDHIEWQQAIIFLVAMLVAVILAINAQHKYMERVGNEGEENGLASTMKHDTRNYL